MKRTKRSSYEHFNQMPGTVPTLPTVGVQFNNPFAVSAGMPKFAIDERYSTGKMRESLNEAEFVLNSDNFDVPNVDRSNWTYGPYWILWICY